MSISDCRDFVNIGNITPAFGIFLLDKAQKMPYNTPIIILAMLYHLIGAIILILNKIRYTIAGYGRPRPFSVSDIDRAINYDLAVFDGWLKQLRDYSGADSVKDKNILELGPGADLGNAFIALARGAKSYTAFDANPLAENCPDEFYKKLFTVLENKFGASAGELQAELEKIKNNSGRIHYICDKNFDLSVLGNQTIDLIFSQAAFEHFDRADKVLNQLYAVAGSDAILIAEIDLQTHTQIIRTRDPLNIYRYSDSFYGACHFTGIPNRVRPQTYKELALKSGWRDIRISPLNLLDSKKTEQIRPQINKKFSSDKELNYLSFVLATKK